MLPMTSVGMKLLCRQQILRRRQRRLVGCSTDENTENSNYCGEGCLRSKVKTFSTKKKLCTWSILHQKRPLITEI
jgi:hypothetical protein